MKASTRSFPTRGVLGRPRFSPIDITVFVAVALLLFGILRLAHAMNASTATAHVAVISTDPAKLPYYAARSLLRMFIAFFLSVVFCDPGGGEQMTDSALDVLTAENLRKELLNLWAGKDFPTKAILLVTHNIEEAVQMADRIFVLSANPGKFKAEIHCDLARPRNRRGPEFEALVDQIYGIMTEQVTPDAGHQTTVVEPGLESPTDLPLPRASVGELAGHWRSSASEAAGTSCPSSRST